MMTDNKTAENHKKWIVIFSLVLAGEMIFSLPFHVARFFRPVLLDVFRLTNAQLGDILAMYGILAMISYFPGGALADRFSARKLLSLSLVATALGGLYLAEIPGILGMSVLFAWWGATTILMFWAALIKATREWGGKPAQGKAFGFLDGGRGLAAAGAATLAVLLFSHLLPETHEKATFLQRKEALRAVIYLYTLLTFVAALLVWFTIPDTKSMRKAERPPLLRHVGRVVRNRLVWLQAVVVVSAYCGYRGLDYYSLYATEVLRMNEVDAAWLVSNAAYIRAVAAILAGILVDRFSATKILIASFVLLGANYISLTMASPASVSVSIILGNIILTFAAVYALRGIYFALLEETNIQKALTGTTVGLISAIGYTPDVFFNSIAGRILDAAPGLPGFQHFFLMLTIFTVVGLAATILISRGKQGAENA